MEPWTLTTLSDMVTELHSLKNRGRRLNSNKKRIKLCALAQCFLIFQYFNLSDSSLETPWREDVEQLRYTPPHWFCTGYYGNGVVLDITLAHSSSTHCRYFKQPLLHLRGVGAICPSLPSGLGRSHISTG
ncbi:hypothetical protein TNCV_904211 [Trichonephila clavipes]|nr:hypothetical protein TNCV_904211 [Trichonephila clavipes]